MLTTYAQGAMTQESHTRVLPDEAVARDRHLVRRMMSGDERAFDEFADTYTAALYRFAMSRLHGDRDLSREVVQNALCKALGKIESYRGEATLFSWLCSVCRNEILMHFRSRKSAPVESPLDDNVTPIDSWVRKPDQPDDILLSGQTAETVHLVLDLLPSHYADALEWKYLDRISVKEIGERLSVGSKAAESILSRARQAFKAGYERVVDEMCKPRSADRRPSGGGE